MVLWKNVGKPVLKMLHERRSREYYFIVHMIYALQCTHVENPCIE